jgi:dTDP-4-dehydrorhamnose reductase
LRIVVIGANGQLGSDLVRVLPGEVVGLTHAEVEVCDPASVQGQLDRHRPDVVINTSAYHKVDVCEDEPERSFAVNALAAGNLARACAARGCVLVHVSTDYVFGGGKRTPHVETDLPDPINVYGVSKLAGEHLVHIACPKHFVVRTCGLYGVAGASGKGGNFAELMIRLAKEGKPIKVVDDQVLTPTYTRDLAQAIGELIHTEAYGLYHVTSAGQCSWYEYAAAIFRVLGLSPDFQPTTSASFPTRAARPPYSVLDNAALRKALGHDLRPWQEALRAYLAEKGHLGSAVKKAS